MDTQKKFEMLEEVLDVDAAELRPDMELEGQDWWDSLTRLSIIVMMDEEFGKTVTAEEIRELKTLQDILDWME